MNRHKKTVVLAGVFLTIFNFAACAQSKEIEESSTEQHESTVQTVENMNPETFPTGEYRSEMGQLIISRSDEQNYDVTYGIYKLAYMENAVGTYDRSSGTLSFSGTDDTGKLLSADAAIQGDELLVTLTHSEYGDCPEGESFRLKSAESQTDVCAFIKEINEHIITVDIAEYITVDDAGRMNELNITEHDMPDGYYIYNPDDTLTQYFLTGDTVYHFIDWGRDFVDSDAPADVNITTTDRNDFVKYIQTYENAQPGMPFFFDFEGTKVLSITEKPMA